MKNESKLPWGAVIERGTITAADGGTYTVESIDRPGVTAWELESTDPNIAVGDTVYFFVFWDGKGLVIRKA